MSVVTKKHLIDTNSTVQVSIPNTMREKALESLKILGCTIIEEEASIPWREAFPGGYLNDKPSVMLRGARGREELTQEQLAQTSGIPRRHISEMENGKRPIGKENARKLAKALKTDYRLFL